jgi:hypothetical protein
MLEWIAVGAWAFGLVFALVVLGFAGYEVRWKIRRLDADRAKLTGVIAELSATAAQLQAAADRARAVRSGSEG